MPSTKIALSDSAAAALAAWRGGSTPAASGGGGGSATSRSNKKLSAAQGNNLTKYWGTPLSSQKSLDAPGKGAARGGGSSGGTGGGGGGSGDYVGAGGGCGLGAASGGGGTVGSGTPVMGTSILGDVFAVPEVNKGGASIRCLKVRTEKWKIVERTLMYPVAFFRGLALLFEVQR